MTQNTLTMGFVVMLDNAIADTVKTLQQNAHTINKISCDDFITAYVNYGKHTLDFNLIFGNN